MSYYELLLFLHVGGAAIWVGAATLLFILLRRTKATGDHQLAERLGAQSEWLTKRLFIPASVFVLVVGVLLTIDGPWGFGDLWILIGLAGWAATFVVGAGFIEPTAKKMQGAIGAHGPGHPDVGRYARRLDALSVLDLALLFAIVWAMVTKPYSDDVLEWILPLLAVGLALLLVLRAFRAGAAPPAAERAS